VVGRRDHGPLGEWPRRYSEPLERIGGISKKMLTQTLHRLERKGLVARAARVSGLTDLGASLLSFVGALAGWAEEYTDAARSAVLRRLSRRGRAPIGAPAYRSMSLLGVPRSLLPLSWKAAATR
jgi:hypothetical protein